MVDQLGNDQCPSDEPRYYVLEVDTGWIYVRRGGSTYATLNAATAAAEYLAGTRTLVGNALRPSLWKH